jgi:hypothetical protein
MVKTFAIVNEGKVVNVVLSNEALGDNWLPSEKAAIGDLYQAGKFVKPEEPAKEPTETPVKSDRIDALINALVGKGIITEDDLKLN